MKLRSFCTITKIYGVMFYSRDLVNDERIMIRDPRNASALGRSKLRYYFVPFEEKFTK